MSHPLSLLIFIFSSNYPPPVDLPPFSLPSLEFISFYFFFYFATKPLLHFGDVCYFSNSSPWIRQSNKYHRFLSNWKIHQLDPLKHHTILMLNIWEMRSKEQHLKLCLTKFDNQTFVLTGLYALNPKGREYNEVLEKLLKEQKESKGYARQHEPYQSRSCYACGSQDHIMRSCPVLAKAKTIRPNEKIYKRTRSALANKQCAYHGWGTHVSKECYAIKKAKEILENGKRNNDSNSPPVQVNTLKNEQLREELNEMKAQMALILEKMPNQQSNA